ncbi:tyrosine-type recombinase/integrase [Actinacidiphila guanduensis]|uniref:tyrosine-type recombinase/integrase n=1 Tax=Actinacidiphila guanduensis TaxID=310781 RepID=UPI0038995E94
MTEISTALAEATGPRWRLMVYLAAFGSARPEEQAALRRLDVDTVDVGVWIRSAQPESATERRVPGDTKSDVGRRFLALPEFMRKALVRHLVWYAEKKPNGLLFVGEKGAPFRRSTFGRKWRKARAKVGLPDDFRFYDLRHTGHGHQHSDREWQGEVAAGLDRMVRRARAEAKAGEVRERSGTDLARDN